MPILERLGAAARFFRILIPVETGTPPWRGQAQGPYIQYYIIFMSEFKHDPKIFLHFVSNSALQ